MHCCSRNSSPASRRPAGLHLPLGPLSQEGAAARPLPSEVLRRHGRGARACSSSFPNLSVETVESSCCGMAGSFGYDAATIDVSLKMGELSLLPAVRKAPADTLIVADGTSCRHQIHDGAARDALHVARVLAMSVGGGIASVPGPAQLTRRRTNAPARATPPAHRCTGTARASSATMYGMLTLRRIPDVGLGDGAGGHQHAGDRRRLLADGEVERHHQPEVDRVDADRRHHRHDDRDHQDDRRRRMQEHAEDQEGDVQQQQHDIFVAW